jgi:Flavodoxins
MKSLIIYYSLEGNVKLLSEVMAAEIGADVLPIKLKQEIKADSFMKYIWGGKQVMMKEIPEIEPSTVNPNDYDLIIIGTPVWAFNYAPAIRSFLQSHTITNKKIALFCTHEGGPQKTLSNLEAKLPNNEILSTIDFFAPLKKNREISIEKAKTWVKNLI